MSVHNSQGDVDRRVSLMYQRVLASWAGDALELRRTGLDRPTQRPQQPGAGKTGPHSFPATVTHPSPLRRAA